MGSYTVPGLHWAVRECVTRYWLPLEHRLSVAGQRVRGVPWLTLSSLGTGTYLGEPDAETDEAVTSALITSVLKGM